MAKAAGDLKRGWEQYRQAFDKALEPLVAEFVREIPLMLFIQKEQQPSNAAVLRREGRVHAHIQRTIMQPAVRKWMKLLRDAVRKGRPNWAALQKQGEAIMKGPLFEGLTYSGTKTVQRMELRKQDYDPMGAAAVDWTNKHGAELVTNVTKEAKVAVAGFTRSMVKAGLSAQETARAMRATVPLLPQHAQAVGTSLTKMLDKGVPFDKALRRSERYAQKLHNYRTKMIARTESSFAQLEGQKQGYQQLGVTHLKRVEDPACCELCEGVQGEVVETRNAYGPLHPHCEGVWVAAKREKPPKQDLPKAELWKRYRQDHNEHGALFPMGKRVRKPTYVTSGHKHSITVPQQHLDDAVYNGGMRKFIHNHPGNASFSSDDLGFASAYNVRKMEVITRNGTYLMAPKGKAAWPHNIREYHKKQVENLFPKYNKKYVDMRDAGELSSTQLEIEAQERIVREHFNEAAELTAKHFKLKYTFTPREGGW